MYSGKEAKMALKVVTMVCALFLVSAAFAQDVASPAISQSGQSAVIAPDMVVNLADVQQATGATQRMQQLRPRDGRTDAQYAAMKQQAALLGGTRAAGVVGAPPASNSGAFLHSPNAFLGQGEICCTPSDMALAVNSTYVVQFVNTFIAVYNKSGVLFAGFPKSADTFFGLPAGTYTTDPRGFYDWTNNRFVFVMLTESSFSSNNVGRLMLAVSQTSNPTGLWNIYKWQVGNTGECPDYPTLGHDTNNWGKGGTKGAIYIGINQFSSNCNGGFIQNYMFVIPKDAAYTNKALPFWFQFGFNVGGRLVDTLQPSNPQGPGDRPSATYLTNTFNILWNCGAGCANLTIWSVNHVANFISGGGGPVFTGVVVPTAHTYFYPPAANQPGFANSIETIDVRITGSMYYHAGHLFGTFETGVPNVPGARPIWFDYHPVLNTSGNITTAEERQEDCFFCGGQGAAGSSFFTTLIPDSENNLTMTYTYSDNNIYPEMAVTGRRVSLADSNMNGSGYVIAGGSGLYTQGRWGDYSAVAPDTSKAGSPLMWTAGDYDASGNWGTAISSQTYSTPTEQ
jgi:hypothetical protein